MAIKPEDVLADNQNTLTKDGLTLRKGSVAAALANVEILESPSATEAEKAAARDMIKELAPTLIALGLPKHLVWKNAEVQQLMEDVNRK